MSPRFSTRLEHLLQPFGNLFGEPEGRRQLAEKTASTRNYFTHYDPRMKNRAVEPARLTPYIFRLKVLFVLHCLLKVGLAPGEAQQCIEKNHKLRQWVRFGKI